MSKLQRNGLAVIVSGTIEENKGRFVTTVRHMGMVRSPATGAGHDCWYVLAPADKPLVGYLRDGKSATCRGGPMPSAWLMPVNTRDSKRLEEISNLSKGGAL